MNLISKSAGILKAETIQEDAMKPAEEAKLDAAPADGFDAEDVQFDDGGEQKE